jgi:superoxide reductase
MEVKFYICKGCGKIVHMVKNSACPTKCCGEPMEELVAGTSDGAREKHVPAFTVDGNIVNVTVGSVEHPMLDAHYIQWIGLQTDQGFTQKELVPGAAPKAAFALLDGEKPEAVYEYCNLHGLWKAEI